MKLTVPTSSTSIYDIMTQAQRDAFQEKLEYRSKKELRMEASGGDITWTGLHSEDAVVGDCPSLKDGDIEFIPLENLQNLKYVKLIAGSGVSAIIE